MTQRKILDWWLLTAIFLFPLFIFPGVRDVVFWGKELLLLVFSLLGLIIWGVCLWREKRGGVYLSFLDGWWLLFLFFGFFLLLFLPSGGRLRALTSPSSLGGLFFAFLFSFLLSQSNLRRQPKRVITTLSIGAALVVVFNIILFLLPNNLYPLKIPSNNPWLTIVNPRWSLMGSVFTLFLFLLPLLAYWLTRLVAEGQEKEITQQGKELVFTIVFLVGLSVAGYQLLKNKPLILDYRTSWAVAVEAFKRNPLTGVGPGQFYSAFTLYRPVEFNQNPNWAVRFDRPSSFFLHLWTEMGTIGLVGWLFITWQLWKRKRRGKGWKYFLLSLIIIQAVAPINFGILFLYLVAVALLKPVEEIVLPSWRWLKEGVLGLTLVLAVVIGFFASRVLVAEFNFVRSLRAVAQNRGGDAYRWQVEAVRGNRFLASYRMTRSQTDLALIQAIASKEDLTDDDRRQIALLVQEAIAEAKAAAALEPKNVLTWENLAQVYRRIINLAQGADQWAITAYQQAIALDPFNPRLRVDLGGVFYGLGNYEEAARHFEAAVRLKGDYANAWYNWAWALKKQEKTAEAVAALQQALAFVSPDTPDYDRALEELESWRKELGEKEAKAEKEEKEAEVLKQPEPLPSPKLEEPIQLPEEAAPEIEITPSPEATPTLAP